MKITKAQLVETVKSVVKEQRELAEGWRDRGYDPFKFQCYWDELPAMRSRKG